MTTPDITTRLRESEDNRSTAQFFFEVGYGAAWADAYMQNGQKAAFSISDESIERAWAIAPEAHEDPEEWDRHMAATNLPPFQIVKESGDVVRSLDIRSPLNRAIYQAIRDFRMGNMCDEDGNGYPLVDLMSNPAPCDIGTGEEQMISLADDVCTAVEALNITPAPAWQAIETAPKDGTTIDVWRDGSRETVYWGLPPHECGEMGSYCDSDWHSIKKPGWICSTFGEFVGGKHDPFTHWMPLPGGPIPSQIEEGK